MNDLIGHTLGPYRIIEQIGTGGMATVFKAYQASMNRYVAIKVLPPHLSQDPNFRARFDHEAHIIARLEHRFILPVYDVGEDAGVLYLVMRYVEGGTLKHLIAGGSLTLDRAAQLVMQIGEALAYAHKQGVIHRDIKPANVLIDRDEHVLLTDFGIAKILEGSVQLTGPATWLGTPSYMAPEQVQGQTADARTDLYALGVVLYECLTGRRPYEADTPMAVALMHVHNPLPPPRQVNPAIPEAFERVILKAMAKQPADRFQTAAELVAALNGALIARHKTIVLPEPLPQPSLSSNATPVAQASHRFPRWPWLLIAVIPLVAVGVLWWVNQPPGLPVSPAVPNIAVSPTQTVTDVTATPLPATVTPLPTPTVVPTFVATAPPTVFEVAFDVYAERGWQSTGIQIQPNDRVEISYQSGNWTENSKDTPRSGPEGIKPADDYDCGMPMSHKETGYNALIAKIGAEAPFKVGSELVQAFTRQGILYLRMNDCDNQLDDNTGVVTVKITVTR